MMVTTHALAGLLLAVPVGLVAPEFATVGAVAALAGGVFPDLDTPGEHRRTLHFPVYYSLAAAAAGVAALLAPGPWSVGAALFLGAAGLHAVSDAFGGGLEMRPWEGTSEEAVYSHYHRRWWRPRRWVRYDGAPEDAALTVALALPLLAVYEGPVEAAVTAAIGVGVGYTAVRKPLVGWTQRLVDALPPAVLDRLPQPLIEEFRHPPRGE